MSNEFVLSKGVVLMAETLFVGLDKKQLSG